MQSLDRQEAILQKLDGFGQGGGPQFRLEASSAQHSLVERSVPADSLFQHLSQVGELDKHGAKRIRAETEAKSLTSNPVEKKGTSNTTATGIILPPCRERELQDQFLAAILGSGGTNHRQSQIHEAHKQTFQWIFTESVDDDEKPAWDSFVDWLESDSQLYWMTGKAGSGKSTLMKFISHHPRLSHHLKKWSKERPVTIASFYFWASGTAMQASPEGMFRSLLHQVLDQNRHIIPKLAPQKWESACLFGKSMAWEPDPQQLHQLLGYAISEISQTSHICLLIDGLDEFNGDPDDLIDTIQEFMSNPINLKVCVSSRPWVVFEDAFYQQPQLLLQDLNRRDIEEYTESMFSTNRGFKRLQAREPRFARQLAKDIVEKAQGVFLWVCVVVTSLLAGMKNDDRIIDLQRRLDTLPPDLEDLYDAIVKSWDPFYFQHAAQYFKLLEATGPGCDARIFFLVDIEDLISYAIELNQEPLPVPEYAFQVETVKRRLNSRCLGLLEVRTSTIRMDDDDMPDTVEYLHRTVKDYVTKPEVQTRFQAATKSLDPYLHLCAAHLAAAKSPCFLSGPWNSKSDTLIIGHCYNALKFASKMAKANTSAMPNALYDMV
ncbi:hypothetical protein QBC41DRAFT_352895 [Cercophora samala]|uniref:NACHT domain-containing protein n=1 Tax=Cercophora samala TaxID=330535 RepID=A0AA39ZM02_9PEZI|nr:hypothetical protein QBC41DRAFT_352895 [Cercophora samala]